MEGQLISGIAQARKVRWDYDLNTFPIVLDKVCTSLGINVRQADFSKIERKVGRKISGALVKNGEQYIILVNEDGSNAQIRFAIAHELGHYFLCSEDGPKRITVSFQGDASEKEVTANKFAAELLLPENLLEEAYSQMVIPISDSLARKFKVPKAEMCRRLDKLGWMYI